MAHGLGAGTWDWGAALDRLKSARDIKTDAALAETFGVSRQMVYQVRHGQRKPTTPIVLAVLDETQSTDTLALLLSLLDDELTQGLNARLAMLTSLKA